MHCDFLCLGLCADERPTFNFFDFHGHYQLRKNTLRRSAIIIGKDRAQTLVAPHDLVEARLRGPWGPAFRSGESPGDDSKLSFPAPSAAESTVSSARWKAKLIAGRERAVWRIAQPPVGPATAVRANSDVGTQEFAFEREEKNQRFAKFLTSVDFLNPDGSVCSDPEHCARKFLFQKREEAQSRLKQMKFPKKVAFDSRQSAQTGDVDRTKALADPKGTLEIRRRKGIDAGLGTPWEQAREDQGRPESLHEGFAYAVSYRNDTIFRNRKHKDGFVHFYDSIKLLESRNWRILLH